MLVKNMIKIILLLSAILLFSGCVNKRGVSMKYYNDCKEYYDLQGFYHKDCDKNEILEYQSVKDYFKDEEKKPTGNVW